MTTFRVFYTHYKEDNVREDSSMVREAESPDAARKSVVRTLTRDNDDTSVVVRKIKRLSGRA